MDLVWLSVSLRADPATGESTEPLRLSIRGEAAGTGETEPREWARDALVAALELL